jgi:acetyl esterase/lipase
VSIRAAPIAWRKAAALWLLIGIGSALSGCTALSFAVANAPARLSQLSRSTDIAYGELARQQLDVYRPVAAAAAPAAADSVPHSHDSKPVIIFWYGGAWTEGTRARYRFIGAALSQLGYVTVLPDYRLYPEVRFPDFMTDGARAVAWVQAHIADYGGDARRIVLMGHSAGAHMASLLVADPRYLKAANVDAARIVGLIGLSGPYDLTPNTDALHLIFAAPATASEWQPVAQQRRAAPPTLLIHGVDDELVRSIVSENYAAQLRALGTDVTLRLYTHCDHICPMAALSVPARRRAATLADVAEFLRRLSAVPVK